MNRSESPKIVDAVDFNLQLKKIQQFSLDNSLPVYAINAGAEELVMIEFVFYAGNWYEEKNIIAATTNFMLKNGTTNKKAFAINELGDIYLVGRLPLDAVNAKEIDRLIGSVLQYSDSSFNPLLELGFADAIRREWAWRLTRGESLANLEAFKHLI